jgi:hypothetical protein
MSETTSQTTTRLAPSQTPPYVKLAGASAGLAALSAAAFFALPALAPQAPPSAPQRPAPPPIAAAPSTAPMNVACPIHVPLDGARLVGRAEGPIPEAQTQQAVAAAEAKVGGPMSPAFVGKPRELVSVKFANGGTTWYAVIPDGMTVARGDVVEILTRHRDPNAPCAYVPYMITGIVSSGG